MVKIFSPNKKVIVPIKKKSSIVYAQIIFYGALYSLIRHNEKIQMRLNLGARCYIQPPKDIIVRVFRKRLVLFGYKERLNLFINGLLNIRHTNIYTGTGVRQRGSRYKIKPGKVKRR